MPAILRNDDAEALILDIRVARTAATQTIPDGQGAFLLFPTVVVLPGAKRGHLVFPLHCDTEPGSVVTTEGRAEVAATIAGLRVTGKFHWTVGEGPPLPESYRFERGGRPASPPTWADQLPRSQLLTPRPAAALGRQRERLRRVGRDAEHWLLRLTERLLHQTCHGRLNRGLLYRPPIDADDLVQRGLQTAGRLLPVYASKDRPPCSWLGMLRLDVRRDLNRELTTLDWLPLDAVAALTLADSCGIDLAADPEGAWDALLEAAERFRQPLPRIEPSKLEVALRAPALAAHDARGARCVPGPDIDDEPGRVAATVACLVSGDAEMVALAGAGDATVLGHVGAQVRRRLNRRQDQLWEHFVASGQLFATPAGIERFGDRTGRETLAAIDACLQRAAGLRRAASE
ncbi:MAG TPA: hypothetical protein VHT75_14440 [Acidimicrobiales bacterium]|nr:hypothetical protein [Acidimicrobiales bacterium]